MTFIYKTAAEVMQKMTLKHNMPSNSRLYHQNVFLIDRHFHNGGQLILSHVSAEALLSKVCQPLSLGALSRSLKWQSQFLHCHRIIPPSAAQLSVSFESYQMNGNAH